MALIRNFVSLSCMYTKRILYHLFFAGMLFVLLAENVVAQHKVRGKRGEVLAHSLRFDPESPTPDMPQALQDLLRAYRTKPRYAERVQGQAVAPLLASIRDQGEPYNRSTPYYTYSDGTVSATRCITGCVATCIEQVLTYYRYPLALQDTLHGWSTENYSVADVLPGTSIQWDDILMDYRLGYNDAQAQAISDLSLYCGMAAHMNWGVNSSGASISRAVEPLMRVFDYKTVVFVQRAFYSTPAWNRLLRNELQQGRPICYTGHNIDLNGHAFNIDGVDEDGYYHLNWGYNGQYDGYFDLDFLNPFESFGDATHEGQMEGFFNNQTALLLHPMEVEPLLHDSLSEEVALHGVKVENVKFRRQPDAQGFVIADVTLHNTTTDSLNFTFEALTNAESDTALFVQADYVGLTACNLLPRQRCTIPLYCRFTEVGERIFGLSSDDVTFLYTAPIVVERGTPPVLQFSQPALQMTIVNGQLAADFRFLVSNTAASGAAGDMITYFLQPTGGEDVRHWAVLDLPAGQSDSLFVRFQGLEEDVEYTLRVRCRYRDQQTLTFRATREGATDAIAPVVQQMATDNVWHDLQGRRVQTPARGLYIRNNKKIMIR